MRNDEVGTAAREPLRCVFGAVRVGALLGRVRLHLQTDRFLAVHRGDGQWEQACREAGLALGEIVSRMAEAEMDASLAAPQNVQDRHVLGTPLAPQRAQDEPPARSAGLPRLVLRNEGAAKGLQPGPALSGVGDDHRSTGKNACATDAALKRGATSDALLERSAR